MSEWFYAKDNQQRGPVSKDDLLRLLTKGEITSQSLVWRQGMVQWTQLNQIAELNTYLQIQNTGIPQAYSQTTAPTTGRLPANTTAVAPARPNNPFALSGFILGLISPLLCCCGLTAVVGLVLSIIGRVQISQNPIQYANAWMANFGIISNALVLVLNLISTVYMIVTGMEIGEFLRQFESSSKTP